MNARSELMSGEFFVRSAWQKGKKRRGGGGAPPLCVHCACTNIKSSSIRLPTTVVYLDGFGNEFHAGFHCGARLFVHRPVCFLARFATIVDLHYEDKGKGGSGWEWCVDYRLEKPKKAHKKTLRVLFRTHLLVPSSILRFLPIRMNQRLSIFSSKSFIHLCCARSFIVHVVPFCRPCRSWSALLQTRPRPAFPPWHRRGWHRVWRAAAPAPREAAPERKQSRCLRTYAREAN